MTQQESNTKHAYLIIAHKNDICFHTLLKMLDDVRNDIFIHMDIKCVDYDPSAIEKELHFSKVFHIKRTDVKWGGASQIWTEVNLLKKAVSVQHYQYYHLLSGQDLPIKTQDYIHEFFDKNRGKEFVRFNHSNFQYKERVSIYHLFQEKLGRNWQKIYNRAFLKIQPYLGIKRNKNVVFYKGTNWFSITDAFARFVVEKEEWLKKVFSYTFCCDEVFLQTLLMMSPYKDNRYWEPMDNDLHAIMRLIDWKRGTPYTFRISDLAELKASDMLFCRKFDGNVDVEVIKAVQELARD